MRLFLIIKVSCTSGSNNYHPPEWGDYRGAEKGMTSQHIDYTPFGEVLLEEMTGGWSSPYKFNAKELDMESGLYYYGARYYSGIWSMFLGVDPKADKYPGWSVYAYCMDNPIRLIDPNGMEPGDPDDPPKSKAPDPTIKDGLIYTKGKIDEGSYSLPGPSISPNNGGNSTPNSSVQGVGLSHIKAIGTGADYAAGVIGLTQMGMLDYRMSSRISSKIGTFSSFSTTYKGLGVASKALSGIGYAGAGAGFIMDINAVRTGGISPFRFGYRTGSLGLSIYTGAAIGGPLGAVSGAAVAGASYGGEYIYDNVLQPLWQEINYQIGNFENALKNGWYPGR